MAKRTGICPAIFVSSRKVPPRDEITEMRHDVRRHHPCLAIHDAAVGAESERHDRAQRDDVHDWPAFTIEIKETLVGFHSGCTGGGWQQQAAAKDEEEVE